jgi:hypothetical protein
MKHTPTSEWIAPIIKEVDQLNAERPEPSPEVTHERMLMGLRMAELIQPLAQHIGEQVELTGEPNITPDTWEMFFHHGLSYSYEGHLQQVRKPDITDTEREALTALCLPGFNVSFGVRSTQAPERRGQTHEQVPAVVFTRN